MGLYAPFFEKTHKTSKKLPDVRKIFVKIGKSLYISDFLLTKFLCYDIICKINFKESLWQT